MSIVAIALNLLLASLLIAALALGLRLNKRLKALRDSHDGFAIAVRELNAAAARAEQGLADLRAATDEAVDTLAERIDKGRTLAVKLDRLLSEAPNLAHEVAPARDEGQDGRLGALLSAARETHARRRSDERGGRADAGLPPISRGRSDPEDDLFDEPPLTLGRGGR